MEFSQSDSDGAAVDGVAGDEATVVDLINRWGRAANLVERSESSQLSRLVEAAKVAPPQILMEQYINK